VHWSFDNWQSTHDTRTRDTGLGTHVADLPSDKLAPGRRVVFTLYWLGEQRWEGLDYHVVIEG
jgi:glucoamylase